MLSQAADRREFLKRSGRLVLLGGLGGLAFIEWRRNAARGPDCPTPASCAGCALFAGCELPPAVTVRLQSLSSQP